MRDSIFRALAFGLSIAASAATAGCSISSTADPAVGSGPSNASAFAVPFGGSMDSLAGPALIAVDEDTGALQTYEMQPGGNNRPRPISKPGIFGYGGLVGNGRVIVGLTQNPSGIVEYDTTSHAVKTIADPNGTPVDIAIGKDGSLYVINFDKGPTNVTYYPRGSANPKALVCKAQDTSEYIAVDPEGDIFLNGYDIANNTMGVVEIPIGQHGPEAGKCKQLDLQPEIGYVAGVAIDPHDGALITLENPDLCAGGEEGRMTVYPKPYRADDYTFADIGQNCSGELRLNRDATIVFAGDEDVSGSYTFVIQSSFPDGRFMGEYHNGQPGGFTTIPNVLPN